MALTNVQNEFLKMQLANNPEFRAEYFPNVITQPPTGPLYNVDYQSDRPANVFYKGGAEFRDVNVPYDTPGSRINIKATSRRRYEDLAGILRRNKDYTDYAYMDPRELTYKGEPITGGQTQRINVAPWILESYGTATSSPRNEMVNSPDWWHAAGKHFDFETDDTVDQATLNDFIEEMLGHEVGHGVGALDLYAQDTEGATDFDFSEFLTPNIKQGKEIRESHIVSEMGKWEKKGYSHIQEELFNRMKDIERLKMMHPDDYEDHSLWSLYQTRAKQKFSEITGQDWRGKISNFDEYKKKIQPYVNKYFEKVKKKGRGISSINIKKQEIGMPEHLTITSTPKKTYVSRGSPHDREQPGSMPTGTAGKNPWGRATGGLATMLGE